MRRPANRRPAQPVSLSAPIRGLYEAQPAAAADPLGADYLQNFLPTDRGIKVRGGISRYASLPTGVQSFMVYNRSGANALFAAISGSIYNITSVSSEITPAPAVSALANGDWSSQQIGTTGGSYLVAANGTDFLQIYDGAEWNPLGDQAIRDLDYDGLVTIFEVGETVTGGTSGATAVIYGTRQDTAATGTLKIGTITGGPFQDNEAITSASGEAVANGADSAASALTIAGVDTSDLSQVWLYQNRLFFVQKDTLTAWYLPAGSVGGTALDVSLAGVFRQGGSLLFGATWALDTGDGLDDKCVFVSTEGEVAVYAGTDPSNASTWALEGRYDIGKPLGKRGTMQAGGDLLIATDDGIVPMSAVVQKDPAALSLSSVTRPIRNTWFSEANGTSGVELHKWTDETLLLTVFPGASKMLTANLQTAAWAEQTGWFGDCAAVFGGNAYVGRSNGRVYQLNDTGADDGDVFVARVCFSFSSLGDPTTYKAAIMASGSFFAGEGQFGYYIGLATDYRVDFGAAPSATPDTSGVLVWNGSNWGAATWGADEDDERAGRVDLWRSIVGSGRVMAPVVQIASGTPSRLNVELLAVDLLVESGRRVA